MKKMCSKCGMDRELSEFNADSRAKDLKRSNCRTCQAIARSEVYFFSGDRVKQLQKANRLKNAERRRIS